MPIYKTFSKRKQEAENSGKPVIYTYDYLPKEFKVQVIYLWRDVSGAFSKDYSPPYRSPYTSYHNHQDYRRDYNQIIESHWQWVIDILTREAGVFKLVPHVRNSRMGDCSDFLLENDNVDQALDLIELSFHRFDKMLRQEIADSSFQIYVKLNVDDVINELNYRFQEHAIGYQYAGGQIVKINSQYLHSETVEPAITLLHDAGFQGALQEFMDAHKCYREKDYKNAIVNASNAFESTMKIICDARGWAYPPNATSSKLIYVLFDHNLVSPEMKSQFTSLQSLLASGVPTIRNKGGQGGHGQGSQPVQVPDHVAAYALHLTASNIVFLVESHKTFGK